MTRNTPLIRVVDDEAAQRQSIETLLMCEGWEVATYSCARAFLENDDPARPGCLILDVRMPEISGIELQRELKARRHRLPIIFLTGHGDIDMAVHVLKEGAKDFLQKPLDGVRLLTSIASVVQEDLDQRAQPIDVEGWLTKLDALTDREYQIILLAANGLLNREIAERYGISERTVHTHRRSGYLKLGVHSVADLAPVTVLAKRGLLRRKPH